MIEKITEIVSITTITPSVKMGQIKDGANVSLVTDSAGERPNRQPKATQSKHVYQLFSTLSG